MIAWLGHVLALAVALFVNVYSSPESVYDHSKVRPLPATIKSKIIVIMFLLALSTHFEANSDFMASLLVNTGT